jgi:hypothetical protein
MALSGEDKMEETNIKLLKQQLCWNVNNIGVSSDSMEQEDEGQGW